MAVGDRDWVVVCGGFHERGGMDRANLALAEHLSGRGARVHLVSHEVEARVRVLPHVRATIVPRVGGFALGEIALERCARTMARRLRRSGRNPYVVANGGNYTGADLTWVHSVHHAWPCRDAEAPLWFRVKNRVVKQWSRRRERTAVRAARVIVANSDRTRADVINTLDVAADVLLVSWNRLHAAGCRANVIAAGPGSTVRWRRAASEDNGFSFVGQIDNVGELLNAADLFVAPVAYEAYGLAAHEALCRGVPVIITATAGIAERVPRDLAPLLLPSPPTPDSLVSRMQLWAADPAAWRSRAAAASAELRTYRQDDMASRIVDIAAEGA
jgi:hypothetical protein